MLQDQWHSRQRWYSSEASDRGMGGGGGRGRELAGEKHGLHPMFLTSRYITKLQHSKRYSIDIKTDK